MRRAATPSALCLAVPVLAQPPLTSAKKQRYRRAVQACWRVTDAATAVTIGFSLDRDGRPDAESRRVVAQGDGDADAVHQSFEAAKRAVLRCGRDGYTLAVEKYEQWRDIELTFDPERTSLR